MVHAKNYETVSTFFEVMQSKLWPRFPDMAYVMNIYTLSRRKTVFSAMMYLTGRNPYASFELLVDLTSRDELGPRNAVNVGHREANKVKVGCGAFHPVSVLLVRRY